MVGAPESVEVLLWPEAAATSEPLQVLPLTIHDSAPEAAQPDAQFWLVNVPDSTPLVQVRVSITVEHATPTGALDE